MENKEEEIIKIELEDYCRVGHKPKYYTISSMGQFAYSHKDDVKDWVSTEKLYGVTPEKGDFDESMHELKDWKRKQGNTRTC